MAARCGRERALAGALCIGAAGPLAGLALLAGGCGSTSVATQEAEVSAVRRESVRRRVRLLVASLGQALEAASGPRDTDYERLRLYLALTAPGEEGEPNAASLAPWVTQELGDSLPADEQDVLAQDVEIYLADSARRLPRDRQLVARVRAHVTATPERLLDELVEERCARPELAAALPAGLVWEHDPLPEPAFTRLGWECVRAHLESPRELRSERWVLGDDPESDIQAATDAYYRLYIERWRDWLASLRHADIRDHAALVSLLTRMTANPSPVAALLSFLRTQTALPGPEPPPPVPVLERSCNYPRVRFVNEHLQSGSVRAEFASLLRFAEPVDGGPSRLDRYLDQLRQLRSIALGGATHRAERAAAGEAAREVRGLIEGYGPRATPRLYGLLWPPIDAAGRSLR